MKTGEHRRSWGIGTRRTSRAPTRLAPTAHAAQVGLLRRSTSSVAARSERSGSLERFTGDERSREPLRSRQIAGSGEAFPADLGNQRSAIKSPARAILTLGERQDACKRPLVHVTPRSAAVSAAPASTNRRRRPLSGPPSCSVREGGLELTSTPSLPESRQRVLPHKIAGLRHVACG